MCRISTELGGLVGAEPCRLGQIRENCLEEESPESSSASDHLERQRGPFMSRSNGCRYIEMLISCLPLSSLLEFRITGQDPDE
jgi:hypothetical protein